MYTLVLMSALSSAPDTTDFNGFFRDLFSFRGGCRGSEDRASGRESGCSGCSGGGLFHGGIRNWFSGCHGSCTGCNGGSGRATSPTRSGTGCNSGIPSSNCQGGGGCSGGLVMERGFSCTGGVASGSCYGSLSASCFGSMPASCLGGSGLGGSSMPYLDDFSRPGISSPGIGSPGLPDDFAPNRPVGPSYFGPTTNDPFPVGPPMIVAPPSGFDNYPTSPSISLERGSRTTNRFTPNDSQRGTVVVRLPVDAKLFAEGRPLTQTAGERKFVTPPLPTDREAIYTFRVEYVREGRTVSESQKVQIRAGGTTTVEFTDLTATRPTLKGTDSYATGSSSVKQPPTVVPPGELKSLLPPVTAKPSLPQDRAKIIVKLPPGATLFVDGRRNERSELVREFTTPILTTGREYSYAMKAEWKRNNQPEMQEQKITFRAGEQLVVDFTTGSGPDRASR